MTALDTPGSPSATGEPVAVVGGGMLGMTLALRFAERGAAVTLFERAPELGGLASAWRLGDVVWDRHYHVTLFSDRRLRALLDELGLAGELVWTTAQTGFYSSGRFHSMNNLVEFLRFPPLGPIDKLRLGATILYASRIANPAHLEEISVEDWLVRVSGRRTFERIWRPLLRAKLGERYHDASAAFLWAIVVRLYAARRAGLGAERFGYVRGGYAHVLDTFARRLAERGVRIRLGANVRRVGRTGDGVAVSLADGAAERFSRAVVTVNAPLAARLCPDLTHDELERLREKRYGGIVCASLLVDAPLGPYYVNNLTDEWVPFSAVIDLCTIVDRTSFGGKAIVYLPKYLAPDDPFFEASDAEVEASFLAALERMYPRFARTQVHAFRVSRVREVFAIATKGYSKRLPPIATSVPGLFLATSAHIVNGTLNVNETVALAERAFEIAGAQVRA